ncbi:MAG: hypothetical protein R2747_16570 [Pyrinomonadaceae bacterium]
MPLFFNLKSIVFVIALAVGVLSVIGIHSGFINKEETFSKAPDEMTKPVPVEITESNDSFRPDGGFEFKDRPSKAFRNINWLTVMTGSSVGYGSACAPSPCTPPPIARKAIWVSQKPRGLLKVGSYYYGWRAENLSFGDFSFKTNTHKKIGYKFVGRFVVKGNYEESKPAGTVLTGRLTKLFDGKPVAEEDVSFSWFGWEEKVGKIN